MINMNTENEMVQNDDNSTVLVSCCGCGEELRISQHEADQWTDTDWFQCHECE
jgi:RNase P subunit RPR2